MTQQEYEQKKAECWEHIKFALPVPNTYRKIFGIIFDRAYTLCKQTETILQEEIEKVWQDYAKEIGLPESLNYDTKSMIEIAIKQAFRAGATLNGKQEKDADTVIQGWVCRDENGRLCLYQNEPKREAYDFQPRGYWTDKTDQYIDFPPNLFPDLTWEDEPQEVEITIKRKKK